MKMFNKNKNYEISLQPFICAGCGMDTRQSIINDYSLNICSESCLEVIEMQCVE